MHSKPRPFMFLLYVSVQWVRACCDAQEAQEAAFDAQRKLQEQVHELQAKQQALQGDIGAQVRACVMHLPHKWSHHPATCTSAQVP